MIVFWYLSTKVVDRSSRPSRRASDPPLLGTHAAAPLVLEQECKSCLVNVYPYKQKPLEKSTDEDADLMNKPHLEHLCEKCKRLGYSCRTYKKSFFF